MKTKQPPAVWIAVLNAPLSVIPGHVIKTAAFPHTPIALVPEGGGTKGKPQQLAHAHLIAAAPELLAALQQIISNLPAKDKCASNSPTSYLFVGYIGDALLNQIHAAIAKAKGKP